MPLTEQDLVDGNIVWDGGQNASTHPSEILPNQYFTGINIEIPRFGGGIKQRSGFQCQTIIWEDPVAENIFKTGNVQGVGHYYTGKKVVLVASISGYIFEFESIIRGSFNARIINYCDRNNPNLAKVWIIRIPQGVIVNDGDSIPYWISEHTKRRTKPNEGELVPGLMGVYTQNRLFYGDASGEWIWASDFRNPLSLKEAYADNLWGFPIPNDDERLTAVGEIKKILSDVEGSSLAYATNNHIYSVDVRGSRTSWENISNSNLGKVQEVIPSIGASSGFSFESFNTNLYFRAFDYGVVNLTQSQAQFLTEADFESQSVEVSNWLEKDEEQSLDQCYTKRFNRRLYTTTRPGIAPNGFLYWNGMVVLHPMPDTLGQQVQNGFTRRWEGLITGVNPWAIEVTQRVFNEGTRMYVWSFDDDGETRLYEMRPDLDHDINHRNERIDIESRIITRGYDMDFRNEVKVTTARHYRLRHIKRDVKVKVSSKTEAIGNWKSFFDITHRGEQCFGNPKNEEKEGRWNFPVINPSQARSFVVLPQEQENDDKMPAAMGGHRFYSRQYRIDIKGPFLFDDFTVIAKSDSIPTEAHSQKRENDFEGCSEILNDSDFDYSVANGKKITS